MNKQQRLASPDTQSSTWLRAWKFLDGHHQAIGLQVILSVVEGLAEALILTLFALLALDLVEVGSSSIPVPIFGDLSAFETSSILIATIILRLVLAVVNVRITFAIQNGLISRIRSTVLNDYAKASWLKQEELDEGAVQQLVLSLPNGVGGHITSLIGHFGQFVVMFSMLFYAMFRDPLITLGLLTVVLLASVALRPLRVWIRKRATSALAENRKVASGTAELVGMRFEAHCFGLGEHMARRLMVPVLAEARMQASVGRLKGTVVPLYISVSYLAVTFGLLALASSGNESLYDAGPILLVVLRSFSYGSSIQQATSNLASLGPMLDLFAERLETLRLSPVERGTEALGAVEEIQFRDVCFSYPNSAEPALQGANVNIDGRTKVGVIGPSGGGKSTFLRLLMGLIEPKSGELFVNGQPPRMYSNESWRSQVAIVPQRTEILQASVAENIRFFRDEIGEEQIRLALERAGLAHEIELLPEGLYTRIGAGGRALSGGQLQRLAVARAFAGQPTLIVMDEPTSSLDVRAESALANAVDQFEFETTVIIVSHRMAILEGCDQLIIIDGGCIRGAGPAKEVLASEAYKRAVAST